MSHHVDMALATSLDVRPVSPNIGAEIRGLDLSKPLGEEVVAQVRAALCRHLVLFFFDQDLSPEEQAEFAGQFGEVTPAHPVIPSIDGHPNVLAIDGREDRASWWHTDVTFLSTPPLGSILHMRTAPDVGGDTMWVSLQAAYDALAEPVRELCDKLIAWHHDAWFAAEVDAKGGYMWDGVWQEKLYPTSHPVVRTHPETQRNGLFVNSHFTRFIEGLSNVESEGLLDMLYRHCQRPEFCCRFRWRPGAVAFWDNRATLHYALDDYGKELRIAHRVTLRGEPVYGPARPRVPVTANASSLAPR
jgi:alpha-ketoglutarate-dependent taurine dioxygenase